MQENQEFKTSDALMAIALAIVLAATIASALQTVFADSSVDMARIQSEKIAAQILTGMTVASEDIAGETMARGRMIASVTNEKLGPLDLLGPSGEISKDPWGQPYFYRILSGAKGKKIAIVWSMGPDQRSDTPESMVSRHERALTAQNIVFGGDDLGSVILSD
jgi:hypothetical protein